MGGYGLLARETIETHNGRLLDTVEEDYEALGNTLSRRGIDIDAIKARVKDFSVAVPSWGAGIGGTRFARFPMPGEPTNIHEKLEDCAVVNQLCRMTPRVSPHFPWDFVADYDGLRDEAEDMGLGFDAVNSNTFQDQPGQKLSYRYGSLTATDKAVRDLAVAHNIECIKIGEKLGSRAITVWIGDGTNFPGQQSLRLSLDRYLDSMRAIYAELPADWRMLIEHKLYEPAFYSTVISDWGSSILAAQQLGEKAQCLVDLGHHAPNVNIEQIVARLARFGKLGGFHFNDSKYGDDDLDTGSINPHQLFLVFNELAEAERADPDAFDPSYMIDQSHNITDPIESMLSSAEAIVGAFARAEIVDRAALEECRQKNDVMAAFRTLRLAYSTDVSPILALARIEAGGAVDPIFAYRESGWRLRKAQERKAPPIPGRASYNSAGFNLDKDWGDGVSPVLMRVNMHATERDRVILSLLEEQGFVSFRELSHRVTASPATLRRDLERLQTDGKLVRVRGGVQPMGGVDHTSAHHLQGVPFHENINRNRAAKEAIGKAAAELCKRGEAIIIDGGSTTLHMCPHLEQ
ncbi:MAG: DeoR family transcriptional regulator, partial [Alphaproteobacteria bacterium]|nr:DeoR family transcriptional regulator [Alphaproteobacteria bacterium]